MPIFRLNKKLAFPHPELADESGLLAVGGDLSVERLLLAYENGIFPWYGHWEPIQWWSLDPRMILIPDKFRLSKSLRQSIRKNKFEVKTDTNFESVINSCAKVKRKNETDTWINNDIIEAYTKLHKLGFAHSVETYCKGELVGGLYGLTIGGCFCGESMFHLITDASKTALYALVLISKKYSLDFIDTQQVTMHLASMGAEVIERKKFLDMLYISRDKALEIDWTKVATEIDIYQ